MASLYKIGQAWLDFLEAYAAGEVPEEAVNDTLESIEGEFEVKADNIAKALVNIGSDIEGIKTEEARLRAMRESMERQTKRLKNYLYEQMKITGKTKFATSLFKFSICKNGGVQPLEITGDVPFVYQKHEPDIAAIRAAIDKGEKLDFATLLERGEHLRIK